MKTEHKSLRIGAAVILFAVILRLTGSGLLSDLTRMITHPTVSAMMLYAGTGQVLSQTSSAPQTMTLPEEIPVPTESVQEPEPTEAEEPVQAVFSVQDTALISLTNYPGYELDLQSMLTEPLAWNLKGENPTVLIVHSHTCESYENTEGYTATGSYRTTDDRYNMISIGNYLTQCLEEMGISVLHDTTVHDYPSYNASYTLSRQTVQEYLEAYPSIQLVLDIHRDAYEDKNGNQIRNTVDINGTTASKLMLVAGTNAYGEGHTDWRENLSMAVKLQATLERMYPGLCRPLAVRSSAFNQDLSPGALLVEVGTAGDTRQDALHAAKFLAEGIAALAYGTACA